MKEALIIFAKNAELGKVKTRLATTIGNEHALLIYQKLLDHTISVTKELNIDKMVYYSDSIVKKDPWNNNIYQKKLQCGKNLGDRMKNAFKSSFAAGYEKVVIIGTDCFDLNETLINKAFETLKAYEIAIGPAEDGGYYLLGMKNFYPSLFENIEWSTDKVLKQTFAVTEQLNKTVFLLPELSDIDNEKDLKNHKILFSKSAL